MNKRIIYICIFSLFFLSICMVPSIADNFANIYAKLMNTYSSEAYYTAMSISGRDEGLTLTAHEEQIYQLGIARGYDLGIGQIDTSKTSDTIVWVPINGGTKYHKKSTCSNMKSPQQVTLSEAKRLGFKPCGRCHPPE